MKLLADYLETIKEIISIEVEPLLDESEAIRSNTADRDETLDAIITALATIYDTLDECVSHIEELKQEDE